MDAKGPIGTYEWRLRSFAAYFVTNGGNATDAALSVGYSAATAYSQGMKLVKKGEVQALIQQGQARLIQRAEISVDWVIAVLRNEIEREDSQPAARVRSAELIGKAIGMWPRKSLAEELLGVAQPQSDGGSAPASITFNITNDFRTIQESLLSLLPAAQLAERASQAIDYEATEDDWDDD